VNACRFSAAEETAAILQCAAHDWMPVMIPGALEERIGHSTLQPTIAAESANRGGWDFGMTGRQTRSDLWEISTGY
jgi:hypothetical protein